MEDFTHHRYFLKDSVRKTIDFHATDQNRGLAMTPMEEPVAGQLPRISLPDRKSWRPLMQDTDLVEAIGNRRSRRTYSDE